MPDRIPAEVFPPGAFLKEEMDARQLSVEELAARMDLPTEIVQELLDGTCIIDSRMARRLAFQTGLSPKLWLNLQAAWDNRVR